MKKKSYDIITLLISLIGVVIAGATALFSLYVSQNVDEQFKILNQSYLDVDPYYYFNKMKEDSDGSKQAKGFDIVLRVTNVGNVPVTYNVVKFDVFVNTFKANSRTLFDTAKIAAILFPKQTLNSSRAFSFTESGEGDYEIPKMDILISFEIEYKDIGSERIKKVKREGKFIDLEGGTSFSFLKIEDSF